MQGIFQEVHSPTGIESALVCNFINAHEENIIVSTANELQVYKVREEPTKSFMECLMTFKVTEKIVSMEPIKGNNCTDYLLLAFKEAKLSIVQYDDETHDLKTICFHNYEQDHLRDIKVQYTSSLPLIRSDPESRCAAALINGNRLAVIPISINHNQVVVGSSYVVNLGSLNESLMNVLDFQFLHGYLEPTVAILHEPVPTWAGRIAVKKDSLAMLLISIDLEQQTNPSVWNINGLPFDAFELLSVPHPLGGVLVFSTNSLIYLNQNCPPLAVSLNSIGCATTNFPMKLQEIDELTLDCCKFCPIDYKQIFITTKEGELYVLSLLDDNASTVNGFQFDKVLVSVMATCICVLDKNYLFLGSRLEKSNLLKFSKKHLDEKEQMKCDSSNDNEDLEEMNLYGRKARKCRPAQFTIEICDSFLNIGPCNQTIIGPSDIMKEEFADSANPAIDLVTISGFNRNGAISVLQRNIRPEIVASFSMADCTDMWSVIVKDESGGGDNDYLSLMIMNRLRSTVIIKTGSQIAQLDRTGFITKEATIFAGNLGGNKYIVQVSKSRIRLMQGTKCLQTILLDQRSPVVSCASTDPYLALLTESNELMIVSLEKDETGNSFHLVCNKTENTLKNVTCISLYRDDSGIFCGQTFSSSSTQEEFDHDIDMLDEEVFLYGNHKNEKMQIKPTASNKSSHWLITHQRNGDLTIYSLPDLELKFKSPGFGNGHHVLYNILGDESYRQLSQNESTNIREITVAGLGHNNLRPHLLVIINQDLVIYEAFSYANPSEPYHSELRFKKVTHVSSATSDCNDALLVRSGPGLLRLFENVSSLSGVFLCGYRPLWIFMTSRGILRLHPMTFDGPITAFSFFHSGNCQNGFAYLNSKKQLQMSKLYSDKIYDSAWPLRVIPLMGTPYQLAYHMEKKVYAVSISVPKPCNKIPRIVKDNELEIVQVDKEEKFLYPKVDNFSLQFYSGSTWELIPQCQFELDDFERVTCLQIITLKSGGTKGGTKDYIVCGTTYSCTEDVPSKGRIIIMDVIDVVPEPGAPLTRYKLKVEHTKEHKGGVSAMAGIQGHLVSAIGQKIYISQMKDGDVKVVAFIDALIYVHSISVIKNLLLVGDVFKSVTLYRYQEDMKVLSIVSRDMKQRHINSVEYLVDKDNLHFLATDSSNNLLCFSYHPELRESERGQKLIQSACFNIGSQVNSMFRMKCSSKHNEFVDRHTTYLSTLDGSIGFVVPLQDKIYRRLLMLQTVLTWNISHTAQLNPKAARYSESTSNQPSILDGVLISRFHELTFEEKKMIASRIGSSMEQIASDLLQIELSTSHF